MLKAEAVRKGDLKGSRCACHDHATPVSERRLTRSALPWQGAILKGVSQGHHPLRAAASRGRGDGKGGDVDGGGKAAESRDGKGKDGGGEGEGEGRG